MELRAPRRNDLRARIVVPAALAALLAVVAVPTSAAGAGPEPDAAPQGPAVAPDPAPGVANDAPAPTEQPPPTPPAESQPPAPTPVQQPSSPEPETDRGQSKPTAAGNRARRPAPRRRADGDVAAARASSLVRIKALLPDGPTAGDSSSHLVLIAAGALLALVLASGSMLSVASRAVKEQLR